MTAVMDFDWSELVFDLKRAGLDHHAISRALGGRITEGMIRQYMGGTSAPTHWRGELLISLWVRKTGKCREDAPRQPIAMRHTVARSMAAQINDGDIHA